MNASHRFAAYPFPRLVWLAAAALAIHEAEEWNILRWYQQNWTNVGGLSNRTVRTWLIFYSLLGFFIAWVATRFRNTRVTGFVAVFFFAFPFLHAFLHVYWVFYFRSYSPGLATAIGLLIPTCALLAVRGVRAHLVPVWFVALSLLLNLPQFVAALRLGDRLPDEGLPFYRLAEAIARFLP